MERIGASLTNLLSPANKFDSQLNDLMSALKGQVLKSHIQEKRQNLVEMSSALYTTAR